MFAILHLSACNSLCLDIWRNQKGGGGQYLQSIHFGFALGGFVGPLLAEPFLQKEVQGKQINISKVIDTSLSAHVGQDVFGIFYLYGIVGALSLLASLGYMYFGIVEYKRQKQTETMIEITKEDNILVANDYI